MSSNLSPLNRVTATSVNLVVTHISYSPSIRKSFSLILYVFATLSFIHSFIPQSVLRQVHSLFQSEFWCFLFFNIQYLLLSLNSSTSYLCLLPCLPVTFVPPTIVSSTAFLRRQLFRKMSPILPAFLPLHLLSMQ
jgi:hypothetical protein